MQLIRVGDTLINIDQITTIFPAYETTPGAVYGEPVLNINNIVGARIILLNGEEVIAVGRAAWEDLASMATRSYPGQEPESGSTEPDDFEDLKGPIG